MHIVQEFSQILRNFLVTNKVLGIVACVQFGDKVSTGVVNLLNSLWESVVFLFGVFEAYWSKMLKFV